jgi:hypothetical protein
MDTTFNILVIVLACLLGIFLILSIVIAAFVVKLMSSLKRVVAKGEQLVDSAEAAAEMFKKTAAPLSVLRTLAGIVESVMKHKKR